ncbi:MAG: alanine racemase, partial [Bacteroidia bacterium]|nr:alanine racemase [Bacteroidia bacterium]
MEYKITELVNIVDGSLLGESSEDHVIHQIVYDTRKIKTSGSVLFIAIKNNNGNGHNYIEEAYSKGIRSFLVSEEVNMAQYPDAYAIKTEDTIEALQKLAGYHRRKFDIPVLAITGSNGKTIIKEWLYQCLSDKYHVCKSPLSYNSQLGVPLSLLLIEDHHEIAVIEAGISEPGEMIKHQRMILPDTGIFSNLGDAHDSGFESRQQKMEEKASLFSECERIIYNRDLEQVHYHFEKFYPGRALHWGASTDSAIKILELASGTDSTTCKLKYQNKEYTFTLPFRNQDLLQNCLNVVTYLLFDGWSEEEIEYSVGGLSAISNRLEIREGLNDSLIINDSYSLDMASIQMGLDFQNQYSNELKKILVLTDFDQQKNKEELYSSLGKIVHSHRIDHLITIGIKKEYLKFFDEIETSNYPDTRSCLHQLNLESLGSACILVKGARRFGLETLVDKLSLQIHQTVLETDFNAIEHNLKTYKSLLDQDTQVMAVIKAEAYGSGSVQMARFLESRKINYLAVAL